MTLPEVLVAVLILGFVAISLLTMLGQGVQMNAAGKDYASLTNVGKDKIEELIARPYSNPVNADDASWPLAPGTHTETRPDLGLELTWRVTEHSVGSDTTDPATAFGDDPINSSSVAMNLGNVKLITLTVASERGALLGRRDVTLQGFRIVD